MTDEPKDQDRLNQHPETAGAAQPTGQEKAAPKPAEPDKKKRGFWGRLFGGSKSDDKEDNKDKKPAANSPNSNPPQ